MVAFRSDRPPQAALSLRMCPEGRSPNNPQGFTLVELVVVVAALAILAAITIPFMLSFVQASQTRGAAQELKSLLNHARQLSITQNNPIQVNFGQQGAAVATPFTSTAPANMLQFVWTAGPNANLPWTGPGSDGNGWFQLANQAQIVNATANPAFNSLGAATLGATIRVQNAQQTSCLDVVVSLSGRINTTASATCP